MINISCDRCKKNISKSSSYNPLPFPVYSVPTYCASPSDDTPNHETLSISIMKDGKMRTIDLCEDCAEKVYNYIFFPEII